MTCAFGPCVEPCCLPGGCVVRRWAHVPRYVPKRDAPRENSPAHVGVKPSKLTPKEKQ